MSGPPFFVLRKNKKHRNCFQCFSVATDRYNYILTNEIVTN